MARPSNRIEKRREIARALERALATHGLGATTIAAVAEEAGVAPGLIHHHFDDREDLMIELVHSLVGRFRKQLPRTSDPRVYLEAYVDAALAIQGGQGRVSAKAWVGILAEAIRSRKIASLLQRVLRTELAKLEERLQTAGLSGRKVEEIAAGTVSSILGCLVFGAFMPGKAIGFAAPFVRRAILANL